MSQVWMPKPKFRIGFACLYYGDDASTFGFDLKSTTISHLKTLTYAQRNTKLINILTHNCVSLYTQIAFLANLPSCLRMLRISSGLLPYYTHPYLKKFYDRPDVKHIIESWLYLAGAYAKAANIRLSMHPGQYTVLNSTSPSTVANSIADIEMHSMIGKLLGYSRRGEFIVNIHGGSKAGGIKGFRANFRHLSKIAQQFLTVENDENSFGVEDLLRLGDLCPIVLDVHHHWCYTNGEWIKPNDPIYADVLSSWGGLRPKLHLSMAKEEYVTGLPKFSKCIELAGNKSKLRAHSDKYNDKVVDYIIKFLPYSDIMCECKWKQEGAIQIYNRIRNRGI